MPTSKKQWVKLNQVKKARAEELPEQALQAAGRPGRSLKKSGNCTCEPPGSSPDYFFLGFRGSCRVRVMGCFKKWYKRRDCPFFLSRVCL
jgi:hypothetical protein